MPKAELPVQKNDIVEVTFSDLTHEGSAVAKVDGYTLFVPQALPGERASVKVLKTKKGYGFGKLLELHETSPERIEPPCPIYKQCGGCQLQHLSYEGQLKQKHRMVKETLARLGGLEDVPVHPVLGMEDPWRYRNKAQVPVGEREGGLIAGFYQRGSHRIIDMNECLIQEPTNDDVVQQVKEIADRYGVRAYDEKTHKGELRHVVVRYGQNSSEVMVIFVTKSTHLPSRKAIVREVTDAIDGVMSIVQNVNPKRTNTIFGEETLVLWGREVIYDTIGDVKFAISARSFFQVNPKQTKVLYEKALEYARLSGEESVVDAYCGIGTISLFLAKQAGHVYGVEVVPEAVEDARKNAELNAISNVTFEIGKAEDVIPAWHKQGVTTDVVVVDPPRKGCDEALLATIVAMKPKRIVYVSCNPATLARDLKVLEAGGFQAQEVQPVDMFPQTVHVECVAQIVLREEAGTC
ncbi:MAG TPA: 23S rRNA (uracil(1939)-C(5))-methyltransferase RlmD [Bacillales bacterium]|nr:23S rRNA (uracil(1939)-C(5))-methyltransferase RlmD [Bacillales bacterium]